MQWPSTSTDRVVVLFCSHAPSRLVHRCLEGIRELTLFTCRGGDKADSYLGRARNTLDNAFGSAKDDAERTKEDAKDSWGRTKSQARGAYDSARDSAEDVKDDAKDSW